MPNDTPPIRRIRWSQAYRIVPSRFPPAGLFDRIADPADLDAVFAIEAMTNPRLREEADTMKLVPPDRRISGPGSITATLLSPTTYTPVPLNVNGPGLSARTRWISGETRVLSS